MGKRKFQELKIWEKSHQLTLLIYKISSKLPRFEDFAMSSQIRRAAFSIPANIAEGCVKSRQTFLNHLTIANGSLEELKYFLILSKDLHYIVENEFLEAYSLCEEVGKMINSFVKNMR